MADEATGQQGGIEPEGEETDYKALWEQAKAHSREWEKKAKANKAAADELAKSKEAAKTADERIAELTRRLDEKERAEARMRLAAEVARSKGVPADLLSGDTEEEMEAWADRMLAHFKHKPAANVENPGKFAKGDGKEDSAMREFTRRLLGND